MSYMIAEARDTQQLIQFVGEWEDKGFVPVGGMSVYQDGYANMFCQAMHRKPAIRFTELLKGERK